MIHVRIGFRGSSPSRHKFFVVASERVMFHQLLCLPHVVAAFSMSRGHGLPTEHCIGRCLHPLVGINGASKVEQALALPSASLPLAITKSIWVPDSEWPLAGKNVLAALPAFDHVFKAFERPPEKLPDLSVPLSKEKPSHDPH